MKNIMLSVIASMCLVGFGSLSFAEDMGKMKGEMKGHQDEMKGEMKGNMGAMKSTQGEMKSQTARMRFPQSCPRLDRDMAKRPDCQLAMTSSFES